ncbi:MAG: serine hydrolase [Pseudomonadota bacterium]
MKRVLILFVALWCFTSASSAQPASRKGSLSLALPDAADLQEQRYQNSIRLSTKLLCSGVFVSGRDPSRVIEDDLYWSEHYFFDWETTATEIDQANKTVRLRAPSTSNPSSEIRATAIFQEGYGCTLLPEQATRLPIEREKRKSFAKRALAESRDANRPSVEAVLDRAFTETPGKPLQRTRAILVLKGGEIIAERYADGFDKATPMLGWSMGKSVAAIVFGAYAKKTGLDIDKPTSINEWQRATDTRSAITPRHLLNMAGGLRFHNPGTNDNTYYTDLHDHESVYFRPQNIEQLVVHQPLKYRPGRFFSYRNTNTLGLLALVRQSLLAQNVISFADEAVFEKIGADTMTLETDLYGNPIMTGFVYGTPRDWAKLGLLVLNDGKIEGERILPRGWRDDVLMKPSKAFDGYGGQLWLNRRQGFKSLPKDAGYFLGWGSQVVIIIPSMDLVIVRMGLSDDDFVSYFDSVLSQLLDVIG